MTLTFTPTLSNVLRIFAALLFTSLLAACDSDDDNQAPEPVTEEAPPAADPGPGTIVEIASGSEDFETLVAALQATGLDSTLADEAATFDNVNYFSHI